MSLPVRCPYCGNFVKKFSKNDTRDENGEIKDHVSSLTKCDRCSALLTIELLYEPRSEEFNLKIIANASLSMGL